MKKKRYWLIGGIIGFSLSFFLWVLYFIYLTRGLNVESISYIAEKLFRYLYFLSVFGWRFILLSFPNLALYEFYIFPSFSFTLYGIIFGWIYGEIKNKKVKII